MLYADGHALAEHAHQRHRLAVYEAQTRDPQPPAASKGPLPLMLSLLGLTPFLPALTKLYEAQTRDLQPPAASEGPLPLMLSLLGLFPLLTSSYPIFLLRAGT